MESFENESTELLDTVREKTDKSLAHERFKTDTSFANELSAAEIKADSLVSRNREQADQEQSDERRILDEKKELARTSPNAQNLTRERELADHSLERERQASDLAHQQERATADAAMIRERRRVKIAADALFALERGATDADLLGERVHTDNEAELVAADLTHEVDAHNETRALMGFVSRDLKYPLDTISKTGEQLYDTLISEKIVSPEIYRLLGALRRNSSAMERLIADFLSVSSIAAGTLPLDLKSEDMVDVLGECSDIFESIASAKNVQLSVHSNENSLNSNFDRDLILQVLSNLLQNALARSTPGSSIVIEARRHQSMMEVCVTDTGTAISAKEQARIFDKFSHLNKARRYGSGLELHICKGIVEAHGGTISVESYSTSSQNTFRFTLPLS